MKKIWASGASGDSLPSLNRLMVDDDIDADRHMVDYEILALAAYHLQILKQGLIPRDESIRILHALAEIYSTEPDLNADLEDVHGNIEAMVLEKAGDSGKNLRLFLSRNEQIQTDILLFTRDHLLNIAWKCADIAEIILARRDKIKGVMPGYTHYRQGMAISSVTYMDYLSSLFYNRSKKLLDALHGNETLPLGYGSGFGSLSGVDFREVARSLGLKRGDENPMYLASQRGMDELNSIFQLSLVMLELSRISQDFILMSGDEIPVFSLPSGFTTGSSLMANKRNPDFLEMTQGYAAEIAGKISGVMMTLISKSSGYHRDFQIVKKDLLDAFFLLEDILEAAGHFFSGIEFNQNGSRTIVQNSSYATSNAHKLFSAGRTWKDSYGAVGEMVRNGQTLEEIDPEEIRSMNTDLVQGLKLEISDLKNSIEQNFLDIIAEARSTQ
ncbi:MAG: lyase family protein [Candidatus Thermoplasmatota archaeon]|nr:lyase family protein [Candidatus Thermoplasmatota archaeon]